MGRALLCLLLLLSMGFEWPGRLERLRREAARAKPARRAEVMGLLAEYPTERVEESLLDGLEDADAGVRQAAAAAVAQARLSSALPVLLDWLNDEDPATRAAAASALGKLEAKSAAAPLARLLGDDSPALRRTAVRALGRIAQRHSVTPLVGRLDDPDLSVRLEAIQALASVGDAQAVVPLLGRTADGSPEVRGATAETLGELGDPRALATLHQMLDDGDEEVRLRAIAAIGRLARAASLPPLQARLEHADARTEKAIVAALGSIDDGQGRALLLARLVGGTQRTAASRALAENARRYDGEQGARPVLTALTVAVQHASSDTEVAALCDTLLRMAKRASIAPAAEALAARLQLTRNPPPSLLRALAAAGGEAALMPLLEQLERSQGDVRSVLLEALAEYFAHSPADGRAADPLLSVLESSRAHQRVTVVRLLGLVGAPRALPRLRPLVQADDPELRLAAVRSVGQLGDPEGGSALLALLEDQDARIRFEAATALGNSASRNTVRQLLRRLDEEAPRDRHALLRALGASLAHVQGGEGVGDTLERAALKRLRRWTLSRSTTLSAQAVDVLSVWAAPGALEIIGELLRKPDKRRRYGVTLALQHFEGEQVRTLLRYLMRNGSRRVVLAAITALGEHGNTHDVDAILKASRQYHWPLPGAASYALARMVRRGAARGRSVQQKLCQLGRSREPYVRANVAAAMAHMSAPVCKEGGPHPLEWMGPSHAPVVRAAAARWARAAAARGRIDPAQARRRLEQCALKDPEPSVARSCQKAAPATTVAGSELFAYQSDGRTLIRNRMVAVRMADSLVYLAYSDATGRLRLPPTAPGELWIEDPGQTPLEPR